MRALLAVIAVAGVLIACSESPTAPLTTNTGPSYGATPSGCPTPFVFTGTQTGGSDALLADHNGDGAICQLDVLDPNDGTTIHTTFVDNNVPNQDAGCPKDFFLVAYVVGKDAFDPQDRNQNGLLCTAQRGNGVIVTVDDRY